MTSPADHDREQEIFAGAVELPPEERAGYLEKACGGDDAMRSQIEQLLDAYDGASGDGFLDHPTGGGGKHAADEGTHHPDEHIGAIIGPYKLIRRLGEGGFGTVYEAQQDSPIRRRVALKIIKLGMDTKQVIARFEAERQALAMMEHPGISKVFDAGSTQSGRPYFVMELVDGEPITKYCDRHRLTIRERLELFQEICRAVQHAHLKGVIHRDLKPSNVLVTLQDHRPVPKVIDFGIAKATEQSPDAHTAVTQFRQALGTPAYMSPEQAGVSKTDIDTRSDVYSLGIMLYELLTGTTPFESVTSKSHDPDEIQRAIRELEPSKPSTQLVRIEALNTLAFQRSCESKKLGSLIKGDLDWITLKAIEKDRTRRYETPNALAADIDRYLHNEPVEASPPSVSYTAIKFARRNRVALSFVLSLIMVLCLGMVGTGVFAVRSVRAERAAAEEARVAQVELSRATEIKGLLSGMLNSMNPNVAQGQDTTLLRSILQSAAERVDQDQITDELVKSEIANTLANVYVLIGEAETGMHFVQMAYDIRSRLLGVDHDDTLVSAQILAQAYEDLGDLDQARAFYERTIESRVRVNGPDDRRTLNAELLLVTFESVNPAQPISIERARSFYEHCRRVLGEEDLYTLTARQVAGMVMFDHGRLEEGIDELQEVVREMRAVLGDDDSTTILAIGGLGGELLMLNRLDEAEPLIRESIERGRRILGDRHPHVASMMNNLAYLLLRKRQPDEAIELMQQAIALQTELMGPDHPRVIESSVNLGGLLASVGRFDEATDVMQDALTHARKVLGDTNPNTLRLMNNLGGVLIQQSRLDEALPILTDVLALKEEIQGRDHPDTMRTVVNLATVYDQTGREEQAADLFRRVYEHRSTTLASENPERIRAAMYLSPVLVKLDQNAEAIGVLEAELPGARALWEQEQPEQLASYLVLLARASRAMGELEQARVLLSEARSLIPNGVANENDPAAMAILLLIEVLEELDRQDPNAGYGAQAEQLKGESAASMP